MNLTEAIQLLNQNGYIIENNRLDEASIIDKAKEAINYIKNKFKTGDNAEKAEATEEAEQLQKEIKSNSTLSSSAKKALLATLIGVMGAMGTANAGVCSIKQYTGDDGVQHTQVFGDCNQEDIQDLETTYKMSAKEKLGTKVDDKSNAKHLAIMFSDNNNSDLHIEKQKTYDEGTSGEYHVVKFSDGIVMVATRSGYLFFYGQGGKNDRIGEYTPYQSSHIYDMAKAMAN